MSRGLSCRFTSMILVAGISLPLVWSFGCSRKGAISSSQTGEDTFQRVKREGVLRVGYILAAPWCIRDPKTGEMSGTFVETINEIAKQMEVRVEYVEADFSTFVAGLQTRKFDISIAPTFSTIPRAKSVAFSTPLMAAGNSAIVRRGESRFKSLADIDKTGIIVAVTQGEQGHEFAKLHFKNAEIRVFSGGDQNMAFSEVLAGRADVALGDVWFSAKFSSEHPKAFDLFADAPYNITPVGWAVRYEDQSLLSFINTALDCLDTAGKLDEIDRKYGAKWLRPKKIWKTS